MVLEYDRGNHQQRLVYSPVSEEELEILTRSALDHRYEPFLTGQRVLLLLIEIDRLRRHDELMPLSQWLKTQPARPWFRT